MRKLEEEWDLNLLLKLHCYFTAQHFTELTATVSHLENMAWGKQCQAFPTRPFSLAVHGVQHSPQPSESTEKVNTIKANCSCLCSFEIEQVLFFGDTVLHDFILKIMELLLSQFQLGFEVICKLSCLHCLCGMQKRHLIIPSSREGMASRVNLNSAGRFCLLAPGAHPSWQVTEASIPCAYSSPKPES